MFCEKCGKELKDDSLFCPSCGTPVKSNASNSATKEDKNESGKKSKAPKVILYVVLALAALFLVFVLIIVLVFGLIKIMNLNGNNIISGQAPSITDYKGKYEVVLEDWMFNTSIMYVDGGGYCTLIINDSTVHMESYMFNPGYFDDNYDNDAPKFVDLDDDSITNWTYDIENFESSYDENGNVCFTEDETGLQLVYDEESGQFEYYREDLIFGGTDWQYWATDGDSRYGSPLGRIKLFDFK